MLFIAQPMDCLATAEAAQLMAASLRAHGIPARGLVIKDGFAPKRTLKPSCKPPTPGSPISS